MAPAQALPYPDSLQNSGKPSSYSSISDYSPAQSSTVAASSDRATPADVMSPNGRSCASPSPTHLQSPKMRKKCTTPQVMSGAAIYGPRYIESDYSYQSVSVTRLTDSVQGEILQATPTSRRLRIRTQRSVPKLGVMLVGLGGNNGTTLAGGIIANRRGVTWRTKTGVKVSNWYGSFLMSSTMKLGVDVKTGEAVYVPLNSVLPMVHPDDIVVGGWDINGMPLGDAMRRAAVFDITLQDQIYDDLQSYGKPLPGVYIPSFIASNQSERADNILQGSLSDMLLELRSNIRTFKAEKKVDKVLVLWTGTTERYCDVSLGVHDSADNLLAAIEKGHTEISASTLYGVAAVLEGCSFINGSPQNTCVAGLIDLATKYQVFVGGDDFKSGQTKIKSCIVDFLVSAGIKPCSIVSYNHLGNNDGKNLSSPPQFRSKEISKSTVVDDMVNSNRILYPVDGANSAAGSSLVTPDHCVVIKYVPYVGDSKRALDEYTSEIFMGGLNTIVIHNTCEDSLLAAPIILDLILLTEFFGRVQVKLDIEKEEATPVERTTDGGLSRDGDGYESFHPVLSVLSYLCKAPLTPPGTPVVNALFAQRSCIVNILSACVGLPPENYMALEHKFQRW